MKLQNATTYYEKREEKNTEAEIGKVSAKQ
jgi:hypothetical protein